MRQKINADDPRYRPALDAFRESKGMSVEDVLLPTQWCVLDVDGKALVVVNADGLRALSLMSPKENAAELSEGLIAEARRQSEQ